MKEELFYPLYKDFDREFFEKLKVGAKEKYTFVGTAADKEKFVKDLFYLQLIKGYKVHLKIVYEEFGPRTEIASINRKAKDVDFTLDFSWASFTHEKQMLEDAEKLNEKNLEIIGSDEEFNEFVLRYLVSIWLADWEGPLYALLVATRSGVLNLKELNEILALWDFTGVFNTY